ncbi:MAG: bifunctional proline dehydrogenase/L-glutamate gamma-semialdehyde dehydrogenase PutA [Rhodospirillales bacterium]|nr:bifunctional proline dehydrogenase/L-glutamate gamma-semialdehyde dehydrogenase PutA [Rhodospirillales bacterium]
MTPDFFLHGMDDEAAAVQRLASALPFWSPELSARASAAAADLIRSSRARGSKRGAIESFLQQYGLDTAEGLALMGLAEALLRIPDARTADAFIHDRLDSAAWAGGKAGGDWLTRLAGDGLGLARKTLDSKLARAGAPVIRRAILRAIAAMGAQFVLGETISDALSNAKPFQNKGYGLSFDCLGEGARSESDARTYFESYVAAIETLGAQNPDPGQIGISVKLSALHPRYEPGQAEFCVPELIDRLSSLCLKARDAGLSLTVDAEESWRLPSSIKIVEGIVRNGTLMKDWTGFGLAVQAYHKAALPLIVHLTDLCERAGRRIQVRLVKGAYWDGEIKRAQILGLSGFPVYTRKSNTDLSYLACAARLLSARGRIYPMFATHNAHTVAAVLEMAKEGKSSGFEFQRLHGMGAALHDEILARGWGHSRLYAPVGSHRALLPYLVRRLLENGAGASFVHKIANPDCSPDILAADPVREACAHPTKTHPHIALPCAVYGPGRVNSSGVDLSDDVAVSEMLSGMRCARFVREAAPLIGGKLLREGAPRDIVNPANRDDPVGRVYDTSPAFVPKAFATARRGFALWSETPAAQRADILLNAADRLESRRDAFIALCVREAGKTLPDAISEWREAVDFLRYYAAQGRFLFDERGAALPGPTGESNTLSLHGRGVFVCISPWNFPLAIFTGQVAAALMAGNAVIAKPAPQTPLIALEMVRLLHEAGVPPDALTLLPGGAQIGAAIVSHPETAGVAFTGSTNAARAIARALADKDGPIVPLIAETGGQNGMIVDSTALPEQVVDDVMSSAFGSAGQRCSALRVLCLQKDIAPGIIEMLGGAMQTLRLGDPARLSTDIGPVIDEDALARLTHHITVLGASGRKVAQVPMPAGLEARGHFLAPSAWVIPDLSVLRGEVFGPVLHIVTYEAGSEAPMIAALNATGYGLTFGMHSRIDGAARRAAQGIRAGNVYINRSMIGAVVGVQPFGGQGLSGTGPKAGGPHYLPRFATEKTVSINTAATGGNAALVAMEEDKIMLT